MKKKDIAKAAAKLMTLRQERRDLDSLLVPLATDLKEYVSEHGDSEDNGRVVYTTTALGDVELRNVKKQSAKLKPSAIDYIKANLPERIQRRLIETTEVVRMDILESLIEKGALTRRQIRGIVTVETTEAFTPKLLTPTKKG